VRDVPAVEAMASPASAGIRPDLAGNPVTAGGDSSLIARLRESPIRSPCCTAASIAASRSIQFLGDREFALRQSVSGMAISLPAFWHLEPGGCNVSARIVFSSPAQAARPRSEWLQAPSRALGRWNRGLRSVSGLPSGRQTHRVQSARAWFAAYVRPSDAAGAARARQELLLRFPAPECALPRSRSRHRGDHVRAFRFNCVARTRTPITCERAQAGPGPLGHRRPTPLSPRT
jgi:hypothetical protein